MKALVAFLAFVILTGCTASAEENFRNGVPDLSRAEVKKAVMVELFTSEGCASCPPAEELLAKLQREQPYADAELITLAFHVDYWDGLGWKDKYASALFTQRQKVYDRKFRTGKIYTPQMVVDGDIEFVGSREKEADKAISKSFKNPKAAIELSFVEGRLKINISNVPKHSGSTVYVAFAEDGVGGRVTGGENAGKELKHVSVVRELKGIGAIGADGTSFQQEINVPSGADWKIDNLNIVVFVQENSSREVRGAARIPMLVQ